MSEQGWFAGVDPSDVDAAASAIRDGEADEPAPWPRLAVDEGFAPDEATYYERLHEAAIVATRTAVREAERASDQQLIHAVRAMDDLTETVNELAERAWEWAGSHFGESREGMAYVREVAKREPDDPVGEQVVTFADRVTELAAERTALEQFVERQAPTIAPNLSALAGPVLAARLIALAGGLESLAKKPSGTVQVLGAEDALFAHLKGHAPSPKHGIIYTHEYVRGTRPAERGSAARALAGKLSIAARIDHYSGDRRPALERELDERIARIRERGETG
ncbi:MAG: NOP5/NOP56 family protein [Halodesulfurarchaeum sp.]